MDNLFLEEFVEKVDPKTIKEIQIHNKSNIFIWIINTLKDHIHLLV